MPLTLDQYATHLDGRGLPWPAMPMVDAPKVRPHLPDLSGVRAVLFNVYGTLMAIPEGELKFDLENEFIVGVALEKTIHEFKMWASMSRKPGQPSEYMKEVYRKVVAELRLMPSAGEKYPEILAEKVWESIIKKLFQKDYKFDATFYGSLNDYSKKVAYFFHASLQGTGCYPCAAETMAELAGRHISLGLLGDGQCFTPTQLARGLAKQREGTVLDHLVPASRRLLSHSLNARKPSDTMFQAALETLGEAGIEASETLHVGSSLTRDIGPAKKWGMKTALFAGDRASLSATGEQLKDPQYRPDAMLTELSQLLDMIS
ncbi:HAD family hydrolase [Zavarzinella formosa]|uniref:HAD family hydrolase n=1 Tax=Zavarzinella formosa TaxID=360055 RepID=UPI000310E581|nr:HAD family hydrolase [Zavarzinella formosa]